jgi:hypothetical protein
MWKERRYWQQQNLTDAFNSSQLSDRGIKADLKLVFVDQINPHRTAAELNLKIGQVKPAAKCKHYRDQRIFAENYRN